MKYDKNAILNTVRNLRSKSSGLSSLQTKLSRISPMKCSSSFYAKRSSLVRRLSDVQSEIDSLSCDIGNAANKMSSDDVQNARYIRQVFNNRTSKITFGQRLFSPGNTTLKRSGIFGSPLMFSQTAVNRRSVSRLGNSTSGKMPWYQKVGNFFQHGATAIGNFANSVKDSVCNGYEYVKNGAISIGNKVGEFGMKAWNNASNFFSNAGKWGADRLNDIKDWGNSAKDYVWKSVTKFVLGDYSEDNITALSFIGNIVAGIFDVDLPLDVRDLVYDIQHWGEGDNFGLYFTLDVVALLPVIGAVKYCKYADDFADGAKDLGKVLDAASDAGKFTDNIADTVDDAKDLGKAVDAASDAGKATDNIADVLDDTKDLGKNVDAAVDAGKAADNAADASDASKDLGKAADKIDDVTTAVGDIPTKNISELPENIQDSYKKYEDVNWKGNYAGSTDGTDAGRRWNNRDVRLPTTDVNGNKITYKEYDVNNKLPNVERDYCRFIRGSDGSVYYTDDHYTTFIKLN